MKMKVMFFSAIAFIGMATANAQDANTINNITVPNDSIVSHKVQMGETVMLIARKYHIAPKDIYKLNPAAVDGISYNMVLSLPADKIVRKVKKQVQATAQAYIPVED